MYLIIIFLKDDSRFDFLDIQVMLHLVAHIFYNTSSCSYLIGKIMQFFS